MSSRQKMLIDVRKVCIWRPKRAIARDGPCREMSLQQTAAWVSICSSAPSIHDVSPSILCHSGSVGQRQAQLKERPWATLEQHAISTLQGLNELNCPWDFKPTNGKSHKYMLHIGSLEYCSCHRRKIWRKNECRDCQRGAWNPGTIYTCVIDIFQYLVEFPTLVAVRSMLLNNTHTGWCVARHETSIPRP